MELPTIETWMDRSVSQGARSGQFPRHLVDQIDDWIETVPIASPAFVHSDIFVRHPFVDGGRLSGIIDWGDAMAADPHVELGKLHLDVFGGDKRLLRAFLDAYDWAVDAAIPAAGTRDGHAATYPDPRPARRRRGHVLPSPGAPGGNAHRDARPAGRGTFSALSPERVSIKSQALFLAVNLPSFAQNICATLRRFLNRNLKVGEFGERLPRLGSCADSTSQQDMEVLHYTRCDRFRDRSTFSATLGCPYTPKSLPCGQVEGIVGISGERCG